MQKNTQAPSGHELPPSLLAIPPCGAPSDRDDAGAQQGILDVIGQGHRPRAADRSLARWAAFAGLASLCVLGWGWWVTMPSAVDGAGKRGAAITVPAGRAIDVAEAASPAPVPEAARIEQVEPQVPAQASAGEVSAQAQQPTKKPSPSSSARRVGSDHRPAVTRTPGPAPSRARTVAARTPDPDVEVIEVLLSRTAAVPASTPPAAARHP